jgi:hypothetical protein
MVEKVYYSYDKAVVFFMVKKSPNIRVIFIKSP